MIGNGDGATGDRGKLHVTMHHNWFAEKVAERMPRVRFGHVHIYNNYYNSTGNGYCIGTGNESNIRLENSHFENVNNPWKDYGATSSGGRFGWSNLRFDGVNQPGYIGNSFPVFNLPYQYAMDPVNDVEEVVKSCAGNVICGGGPPDCNGVPGGTAYLDACSRCVGGNTSVAPCATSLNVGIYRIHPVHSNLCLSSSNPSTQQMCVDVASQYWQVTRNGNNYQIQSLDNDQYLSQGSGVQGENTGTSATVTSLSLGDAGNGAFYLQSATNPALVFDILNISTSVGEPAILWETTGTDNQRFTFEPVSVTLDCNRDINGSATLDACGVCTGGNTEMKACTGSMEAEAVCELDGSVDSDNPGFSGTGFVNTNNALSAYANWVINSELAQTATISFRYANGGTNSRDGAITINGNAAGNLVLPPTGSWSTWKVAAVNLNLAQGSNKIIVTATTADGLGNIDLLSYSSGVSEANCVVTNLSTFKAS